MSNVSNMGMLKLILIPDVGACEPNPCTNNGTCNDVGIGDYNCTCPTPGGDKNCTLPTAASKLQVSNTMEDQN